MDGWPDGRWLSRALMPAVELVGKKYQCYLPRIAGEAYGDASICEILVMCEGLK